MSGGRINQPAQEEKYFMKKLDLYNNVW